MTMTITAEGGDNICPGWRDHGWYCEGGHPVKVDINGVRYTHACPTWPTWWRKVFDYVRGAAT